MSSAIEDETNHDLLISKIISGSGLFVVSVICGVIPFKLAKIFKWDEPISDGTNTNSKRAVNMLLCFGGGVLLATTFLHLLPDINFELNQMIKDGKFPNTHILTGEFFMMMGFFLIFLIEELVHGYIHSYQEKKEREKAQDKSEKGHLELNMDNAFMRGIDVRNSAVKRFSEPRNGSLSMPSDEHRNSVSIVDHLQHAGHGHSHLGVVPKGDEDDLLASSMRGLLIVLALSIHELFEGFAVGLERDPKGVYFMFAAVSAHKYVISFCIGVELMVQQTKVWLAFVYVVIYSAVSAIGIGVGALLTSIASGNAENLDVPNVILQGIATGTLLYVVFFEVLKKDKTGMSAYLSVLFGFSLMAGLQYIAGVSEAMNEGKIAPVGVAFNANALPHRHA